jgi:hypothetical protein
MRTKTLALSAVLGALGTASLVAQTNVYSLNAVGYINVTMPPGFSIITCPLICGTDPTATGSQNPTNTLNVVLNNASGQYSGASVYPFINGHGYSPIVETGNPFGSGWTGGGADVNILPGQAVFFYNPNGHGGANMTATFVGTVPQGVLTNTLVAGYNLVGSIVPTSGDLVSNPITAFSVAQSGDYVYFYDSAHQTFAASVPTYEFGAWSSDPTTTNVAEGFFYYNANAAGTENWVETFSINP